MAEKSSSQNTLASLSNALAEAVENAASATVLVSARRRQPASGIAYAPDLILTADHVIEREEDISVMLPDGREMGASIVGRDPGTDLALLRLPHPEAVKAELAEQEARIGQFVLALGRPSSEGIQASLGIISAIGGPVRTRRGNLIERYIMTDAIPYPGFSGGPLIDAMGKVLGINTSGLARGTSLALPIQQAMQNAEALASHGRVRRGYLGIRSQPVELPSQGRQALGRDQATGLLLVNIESGSPAAAGGLIVGDILVGMAGNPVTDPDELIGQLSGNLVGMAVPIDVLRGGQLSTLTVTIGERQ